MALATAIAWLGVVDERPRSRPRPSVASMSAPAGRRRRPAAATASVDRVGDRLVPGDEPRQAAGAVLGLGERGRWPPGRAACRRRRRPRPRTARRTTTHADDPARDLALGQGDVDVAGTDDHVDRRGSTRCRRRAPRSPAAPPTRYTSSTPASAAAARVAAGDACRRPAAGRTGRPRARRRPWRERRSSARSTGSGAAAGHVAAGPVDRADQLAHLDAAVAVDQLVARPGRRGRPRCRRGGDSSAARSSAGMASSAAATSSGGTRSSVEPHTVEALGQVAQGGVAPVAHVVEDRPAPRRPGVRSGPGAGAAAGGGRRCPCRAGRVVGARSTTLPAPRSRTPGDCR